MQRRAMKVRFCFVIINHFLTRCTLSSCHKRVFFIRRISSRVSYMAGIEFAY